jgi:hypothetical protein
MNCTSKQYDVLVMALWLLITYEYDLPIHKSFRQGKIAQKRKIPENFWLGLGTQMSYQRSWKNSRLEKRNIWENSCLPTGSLTDLKGFCENSGLGNGIFGKTTYLLGKGKLQNFFLRCIIFFQKC